MSWLPPGALGRPFCDFLQLTFPDWSEGGFDPYRHEQQIIEACAMAGVGDRRNEPGTFDVGGDGGTLSIRRLSHLNVVSVGISGKALGAMRRVEGCINELVMVLCAGPHTVTRADFALDVEVPNPGAVVKDFFDQNARGVSVPGLRKPYPVKLVHWRENRFFGGMTGACYVGTVDSRYLFLVYDKTHEMLDRSGIDIGRMVARFEIRVRKEGLPSLRDFVNPGPLYFHLADPVFFCVPRGLGWPKWEPGVVGFDLPEREPVEPLIALERLARNSRIVDMIIDRAIQAGPEGEAWLLEWVRSELRRRARP